MTSSSPTKERAQEAASTAAEEGKHVAGVAMEQAQNVASEAATQAKNLVDETRSQVTSQLSEQSRTQRDNLVGTLKSFSSDLEQMAQGNTTSGLANDLVQDLAGRARSIGDALDGREPQEILDEVRSFARRRPGTFLLGALAAGVIAGRVARGAKQAASDESISGGSTPAAPSPTAGPAPTGTPTTSPAAPLGDTVVSATHGQPTVEVPATGADTGLGTDAAGYGQRGTTDAERPL